MAHLFTSNVPEHFNKLVIEALELCNDDEGKQHFIAMFMSRYVAVDRPLTGYFMICCVVEIQWTVLSQALVPPSGQVSQSSSNSDLAVAANDAWLRLTQDALPASTEELGTTEAEALQQTIQGALQLFSELLSQVEEMDLESSIDTYAWETMAESLVCLPYIVIRE